LFRVVCHLGFVFLRGNDIQQFGERDFCRSRVLREIENIEKLLSETRHIQVTWLLHHDIMTYDDDPVSSELHGKSVEFGSGSNDVQPGR
jgi:hypothetical protein